MSTIITRVGYCPICAKQKRPHTGNIFLAYGSHQNCYHIREAMRIGYYGFTPHIYKVIKYERDIIVADVACGMYECDVDRRIEDERWFYYVKSEVWQRQEFPLISWNSLVLYKQDSLYSV